VDVEEARAEVRRAANRTSRSRPPEPRGPGRPAEQEVPDWRDPRFQLERETLKLVVQHPGLVAGHAGELGENDFTHPTYRVVWDTVAALGGPAAAPEPDVWVGKLRDSLAAQDDQPAQRAFNALAVEPLPIRSAGDPTAAYAAAHVYRLQELTALRRIAEVKSRLQRTNPVDQAADYNRMFGELVALEQHRRSMRELAVGAS